MRIYIRAFKLSPVLGLFAATAALAAEPPAIIQIPRITVEVAQKMAQAALEECRKEGIQIGVTVVDRGGHPVVVLRDTLAPDLTLLISRDKAYTAMSFNATTASLEERFTKPFSVGKAPGLMFAAGGIPLEVAGKIAGGIGVSGAPTGEQDEKCARAGIQAVQFELESVGLQ